eukprot:9472387-Pyramimonas_sp.AAC.1
MPLSGPLLAIQGRQQEMSIKVIFVAQGSPRPLEADPSRSSRAICATVATVVHSWEAPPSPSRRTLKALKGRPSRHNQSRAPVRRGGG